MSAPPSPEVPTLPRAFGRYVLFDHIGRGGMADIFLARARTGLGGARLVVLKQVLPRLSADARFGEMLVSEAKLAAQLNHANVVQVIDLGREDERLFIAMEYVEGFDLNQLLRNLSKSRIPLPAEFAILIVRELLRGLDYAHRARDAEGEALGLVHRDVSPSNVLVSFEGEVKLCDFGIARALRLATEGGAYDGQVAGKAAYMSPEHARGEEIDARADVFAAGILLWELCAGRRLYKGSEQQMLELAKAGEVPPLPDRGLAQPERLARVLIRMTEPNRRYRYPTAQEALDDLEAWAADVGLMASPLRFGRFLDGHFGESILSVRRQREAAARQLTDSGESPTPAQEPAVPEAAPPASEETREPARARPESTELASTDATSTDSPPDAAPPGSTPSDSYDVAGALAQDERFDEVTGSLSGAQFIALESGEHRLEAARVARRAKVTSKAPPAPPASSPAAFYLRLAVAALVVGAISFALVRLFVGG
ncbi:MAG: serine/threonine protein kinase [Deltaproteobacteria bacterium]|nr:serine/threonine protein kinase [Deltaproteobacteria bacterium]